MKEVIILVSGGLDSFIMYHYAKKKGYKPIPLYINIGSPYGKKEIKAMKRFEFFKDITCVPCWLPMKGVTPSNQVIRGRNFILATVAGAFGKIIWQGALQGEIHKYLPDKSEQFIIDFNNIGKYIYRKTHDEPYEVKLEFPFKDMTKTDIVYWALENGITKEELMKTITCYDEKHDRCGKCSTCVKRAVAMRNSEIWEKHIVEPFESRAFKKLKRNYEKAQQTGDLSHYSHKRIYQTMRAYKKYCNKTHEKFKWKMGDRYKW